MAIRDEMQALMDRWTALFMAGDAPACAALYAPDGAIYSPYGPAAEGREAILATIAGWIAEGETNKRIAVREAGGGGDSAYCLAAYSGDYPDGAGGWETESGVSLNIAERAGDGSWRIRISSLNGDTPPPAESG